MFKKITPAADYGGLIWGRLLTGLFLAVTLLAATAYSINVGSFSIPLRDIVLSLVGRAENGLFNHIVWNVRLPRTLGALIAGAGLGLSGAVMQNLLKNPLASPFTLGISQGAACGAAFAIIVLGGGKMHNVGNVGVTLYSPYLVVTMAFLGAMIVAFLILGLSSLRGITTEAIILAGVALGAFFSALTMFMQYFASDVQVAATVFWTFGDLAKATMKADLFMGAVLLPALVYFFFRAWDLNAHNWGEDVARGLGVKLMSLRVSGMLITSLLVASATSFLGIIGFVGLIAPHVMRMFVGNDYRFLIPYSALSGGLFLLAADVLARTVMAPATLPVGIVTSFAGAPFFIYLLLRGRRLN